MLNLHLCINQNLKNIKYSSRNWLFINFESGLPIIDWVVRWLVWALGTPFGYSHAGLDWVLNSNEKLEEIDFTPVKTLLWPFTKRLSITIGWGKKGDRSSYHGVNECKCAVFEITLYFTGFDQAKSLHDKRGADLEAEFDWFGGIGEGQGYFD